MDEKKEYEDNSPLRKFTTHLAETLIPEKIPHLFIAYDKETGIRYFSTTIPSADYFVQLLNTLINDYVDREERVMDFSKKERN